MIYKYLDFVLKVAIIVFLGIIVVTMRQQIVKQEEIDKKVTSLYQKFDGIEIQSIEETL